MSRIAIDAALGSGFGLIRRQPWTMLLWGVVYTAFSVVNFAVVASFDLPFFTRLAANAQLGAEAYTQAMNATLPQMMAMEGWSWLLSLLGLMASTILYCAAFRAILHPEQKRFGYLRAGTTELLLFVLVIAAYIVLVIAMVIVALVVGLLVTFLIAVHAVAAGVILGVLAVVTGMVALVWIALRFSMVGPMMVDDGKFHLFESWALTRGHAGVLFILAICVVAILLVAEVVVGGILLAVGVADLASVGGGLAHLSSFFAQPPSTVITAMAPFLVVAAVILTPLIGCAIAVGGAPWARAYVDLTRGEPAKAPI